MKTAMGFETTWSDEKQLANRLAGIVTNGVQYGSDGEQQIPYKKWPSEESWVLDSGNNWWLDIKGRTATLTYRYGKPPEFWAAMKVIIENLLEHK